MVVRAAPNSNRQRRGGDLTPARGCYLKELVEGTPGQRLSPEEERAVALGRALGHPAPGQAPDPGL